MSNPRSYCIGTLVLVFAIHAAAGEVDRLAPVELRDWQRHRSTYYSSGVQARFTRDENVRRSSNFSLRIEHLGPKPGTALYQTAAVPALERGTYHASIQVRTRQASAAISLRFLDAKGAYVEGPQEGDTVEGDSDWTELTVQAVAPPTTTAVHVFLVCRQGEAWFDDLVLRDDLMDTARRGLVKLREQLPKLNLMKSRKAALQETLEAIERETGADSDRQRLISRLQELDDEINDDVDLVLLPHRGVARVKVKSQPDADGFSVSCSRGDDGVVVASGKARRWSADGGVADLDICALVPGRYVLTVHLQAGDEIIDSATLRFDKPAEPWLDEQVKRPAEVPWPWTAVEHQRDGNTLAVSVWGRQYLFASSALPDQITTRGQAILSEPIRWRMRLDDREVTPKLVEREIQSAAPGKLVTRTVERAPDLVLRTTMRIEFDGMIWFDCELSSPGKSRLQNLDLLIPLRPEHARYRQFPGHGTADRAATGFNTVGKDATFTRALPNYGFCWLGDEERGITWFFTDPGQFRLESPDRAVTIRRTSDAMGLELRVADHPIELSEPLRFSFGLQPTPTRPLPVGWRLRGTQRWSGEDWDLPWTKEAWARFGAGFPESNNPELYRTMLNSYRRRDTRVAPYLVLTWRDRQSPLWRYYREDWSIPGAVSNYSKTRPFWFGHYVCANSDSYRKWLVYMVRRFVADYDVDGLYHDIQEPHFCTNAHHGCAPGRWDTMGMRDVNRGVYEILHDTDRPRMKIDHSSTVQHDAISCFADAVVTGEEMCADGIEDPKDIPPHLVYDDYFKVPHIQAHLIATGMVGGQRGPIPWFLPEFRTNYQAGTRGMMALLLPCDVWSVWQGRSDFRLMHMLDRAANAFGLGESDVEFHGYWRQDLPARVSNPEDGGAAPLVSLWTRPGRGALLIAANHSTTDDVIALIDVDLTRLGLSTRAEVADAEHQLQWHPTDGSLSVKVRSKDFRLLWLRPARTRQVATDRAEIDAVGESHIGGATPDPQAADRTIAIGQLHGSATSRFAQPIKFTAPVRITAASLLLGEQVRPWDFKTITPPTGTINPHTLRDPQLAIVKPGVDGTPDMQQVVVPHTWVTFAECRPQDKNPTYRTYHFDRFVDLEPGTYLIVLSKDAETERSSHRIYWHAVDSADAARGLRFDGQAWRATNVRAAVGVYGYLR